jgi:hypothetical protein
MSFVIRAKFDGSVFVPEEPVALAKDKSVSLVVSDEATQPKTTAQRLAALDRFVAAASRGTPIPDEALRRENLYEDR